MNNKNNFYIFLDFDGVFNYFDLIKKTKKRNLHVEKALYICPKTISVFNRILSELRNNNFNPKIVIHSDRRFQDMDELLEQFKKFGIDYEDKYDRTGFIDKGERRVFDILKFISKNNIVDNFIIIDDNVRDIKKYFPEDKILETSGLHDCGLSEENFKDFKKNKFQKNINNKNKR